MHAGEGREGKGMGEGRKKRGRKGSSTGGWVICLNLNLNLTDTDSYADAEEDGMGWVLGIDILIKTILLRRWPRGERRGGGKEGKLKGREGGKAESVVHGRAAAETRNGVRIRMGMRSRDKRRCLDLSQSARGGLDSRAGGKNPPGPGVVQKYNRGDLPSQRGRRSEVEKTLRKEKKLGWDADADREGKGREGNVNI
ncbi:hypothetical protein K438DRAFT_1752008 [Mycena galopus ATCC 62051]|nr:hypothetical protein K438DRAFT_1752008 [Mycena galopus ATCC 62051]